MEETRQSELSVKSEMKRSVVTVVSPVAVPRRDDNDSTSKSKDRITYQRFDRYQNYESGGSFGGNEDER